MSKSFEEVARSFLAGKPFELLEMDGHALMLSGPERIARIKAKHYDYYGAASWNESEFAGITTCEDFESLIESRLEMLMVGMVESIVHGKAGAPVPAEAA